MEKNKSREIFRLAAITLVLWGLYSARPFFIPVLLAALLAFLMAPLVRVLHRHHFPDWLAISLSALMLLVPLGLLSIALMTQLQKLTAEIPTLIAGFEHTLDGLAHSALSRRFHLSTELTLPALANRLSKGAGQGLQMALEGLRTALEAGAHAVLIFVFSILMLIYRQHLSDSAEKLLSRIDGVNAARLLEEVTSLVEKFFLARLLIVVIISLPTAGLLTLLGIPYGLLLGFVVGVLTLLPAIGIIVGAAIVMPVAIATDHSALSLAFVVATLLAGHLLEADVLTPKMVGGRLNLNALATFLGMFAGGLLWGLWGMFLSIPLLAVLRIALGVSEELHPWAELLAETRSNTPRSLLLVGPWLRPRWRENKT